MKNLLLFFTLICSSTFAQSNDSIAKPNNSASKGIKLTPFNPKGNYETFAIKARLLPLPIGNDNGVNALLGIEIGFLKAHSLSADIMKELRNHNLDAYYRNDSLIRPRRTRTVQKSEFHFAYNYHLNFKKLREKAGLNFYTGINYRVGTSRQVSDTGMVVNDYTIKSVRKYFSLGPQIGVLYNIGKKERVALNINVAAFYSVKNVESTEIKGANTYSNNDVFKTVDYSLGFNLYIWLKYRKK